MSKISVIGAGAWGTALAQTYALSGHDVTLWAREESLAQTMIDTGENKTYLPDITLAPNIDFTHDLSVAVQADIILDVVPAQHLRANLEELAPLLRDGQIVVICAKGIEIASHKLLSDVFHEICPKAVCAILTGPNFARDIAEGKPSAATLAAPVDIGKTIQSLLISKNLRLYATTDMIGTQIAGAIKNVIAIAAGICHGLGLGESARAALITRGLAEIARLTVALGGERDTLMGQCGVGDLMLTCSSMQSRNFSFGVALAQGQTAEKILGGRSSVTEGVTTAKAARSLARDNYVDMPIVEAVHACIYEGFPVTQALSDMLSRPSKSEKE